MSQQKIIPERSAIPQPDTWNTADLYPSDQAWQEDFVRLQGLTTRLAEYEGRLGGSAAVLYGFLTLEQEAGEPADHRAVEDNLSERIDAVKAQHVEVGVEVVLHRNRVQQEVEVPGGGFHLLGIGGHDHMIGALAAGFFSLAR